MTERNTDQLGEMLSAYLDGELGDADRVRVQQLLERDPAARRLWEELQETVATVSSLPRHAAPDSILATVHQQLERRELVGAFDENLDTPARAPDGGAGRGFARWATAAVVGLAAIGGLWAMIDRYQPRRGASDTVALKTSGAESDAMEALSPNGAGLVQKQITRRGRESLSPRPTASSTEQEKVRISKRTTRPELDRLPKPETSRFARRRTSRPEERTARVASAAPSFRTTIARKIARGADAASLRDHSFDAESVQIKINVATASDRDRIIRALTENLNKRAVTRLNESAGAGAKAEVSVAAGRNEVTPPVRFFLAGRAGVNYSDDSRRQLLVRSAIPDVRALLQSIRASDSTADVSLTVQGARVDGFADADDIFAQAHVAAQSSGLVPAHLALPAMNLATQAGRGKGAARRTPTDRTRPAAHTVDATSLAPLSKETNAEASEGKRDPDYGKMKNNSAKPTTANHRTQFRHDSPTDKFSDETSPVDRRLKAARSTNPRPTKDAARPMRANHQVVTFVIDVGVQKSVQTTPSPASTRPRPRPRPNNPNRKPTNKATPPPK